jgi:antitoxin PrlF
VARPLDLLDIEWATRYYFYEMVMGSDMESAITSKGQATIPKAIREHLGLKPGDRIKFFVHPDGSVVLLPKLPVSVLRGIVAGRRRTVTIDEMDETVAEGALETVPRARHR